MRVHPNLSRKRTLGIDNRPTRERQGEYLQFARAREKPGGAWCKFSGRDPVVRGRDQCCPGTALQTGFLVKWPTLWIRTRVEFALEDAPGENLLGGEST